MSLNANSSLQSHNEWPQPTSLYPSLCTGHDVTCCADACCSVNGHNSCLRCTSACQPNPHASECLKFCRLTGTGNNSDDKGHLVLHILVSLVVMFAFVTMILVFYVAVQNRRREKRRDNCHHGDKETTTTTSPLMETQTESFSMSVNCKMDVENGQLFTFNIPEASRREITTTDNDAGSICEKMTDDESDCCYNTPESTLSRHDHHHHTTKLVHHHEHV